jgi:hypothetical protein
MPTSEEHGRRVVLALKWLGKHAADHHSLNPVVTEYFYAALHIFEAAVYDFQEHAEGKAHFTSHKTRTEFIQTFVYYPKNPLLRIGPQYESLRGLSERARYLSPARMFVHQPLVKGDLVKAKELFEMVRRGVEAIYQSESKHFPWKDSVEPAGLGTTGGAAAHPAPPSAPPRPSAQGNL